MDDDQMKSPHKHHIIPAYRCKELGLTQGYKIDGIEFYFKENMVEVERLDHACIHWGYFSHDLEPLFKYVRPEQWIIDLIPRGDHRDYYAYYLLYEGNEKDNYCRIYKEVARFPQYYDMPLWKDDYIKELNKEYCIRETNRLVEEGFEWKSHREKHIYTFC